MKQFFAYFFLLITFFYVGGYFVIFKVSQREIYKEMRESKKNIETLIIPASYFLKHQEKDGKEIRWDGKMFDIKFVKKQGDELIVYAIHDTKEESLFRKLSGFTEGDSNHKNMQDRGVSRVLKLEFVIQSNIDLQNLLLEFFYNPIKTCQTLPGFANKPFEPPQIV